jgi:hypothetical protein
VFPRKFAGLIKRVARRLWLRLHGLRRRLCRVPAALMVCRMCRCGKQDSGDSGNDDIQGATPQGGCSALVQPLAAALAFRRLNSLLMSGAWKHGRNRRVIPPARPLPLTSHQDLNGVRLRGYCVRRTELRPCWLAATCPAATTQNTVWSEPSLYHFSVKPAFGWSEWSRRQQVRLSAVWTVDNLGRRYCRLAEHTYS